MTTPMHADAASVFTDGEYDSYAVMDAVPLVVRDLDTRGSRVMSLFSAFLGPMEGHA